MSRRTAADRFRRIVAIVPWIAARPGVGLAEVCERFQIDAKDLVADLDVVFMVGIPPYTPDALIDVLIDDDDRVWIRLGEAFTQPLRLNTGEILRLVAAGRGALAGSAPETRAVLSGALDKLLSALGGDGSVPVTVRLGEADEATLALLRQATEEHRRVRLDYYAYSSDSRSDRVVDPLAVYSYDGNWYLSAHCHRAGGTRVFRIDRVSGVTELDETFEPPATPRTPVPRPGADAPVVTVEVDEASGWLIEEYGAEEVPGGTTGRRRLRIPAAGDAWLQRVMLQLGPDAALVDGDVDRARDLASDAARDILARYR